MMKKTNFLLFILSPIPILAQIGINKESNQIPLEIKTTRTEAIIAKPETNGGIVYKIDEKGNLFFKNELIISNTTSPEEGDVLISNGPNNSTQWMKIENSIIGKYTNPCLFSNNVYNETLNSANVYNDLIFSSFLIGGDINDYLNLEDVNGNTNTNISRFKVKKEGVYEIIINGEITTTNENKTGLIKVSQDNFTQLFPGIIIDSNTLQFSIISARYLKEDEYIYAQISSNDTWKPKNFNILINYTNP